MTTARTTGSAPRSASPTPGARACTSSARSDSTIFCCLPLGIAAIVYADQVDSRWSAGDTEGARRASSRVGSLIAADVIVVFLIGVVAVLAALVGSGSQAARRVGSARS